VSAVVSWLTIPKDLTTLSTHQRGHCWTYRVATKSRSKARSLGTGSWIRRYVMSHGRPNHANLGPCLASAVFITGPPGRQLHALGLDPRDATRLVEQILPRLNEKQRFVIERVFFEGVKISEVASPTGEPLGNLLHAYYRGVV